MCKNLKFKKWLMIVILVVLSFVILINVFDNVSNAKHLGEISIGEYSERYKEWLELPKEERDKTIPPPMYDKKVILKGNNFLKSDPIPSEYDLRDTLPMLVTDQENTGSCWAFASNESLQSNIQKNNQENYNFSERYIEYATSESFTDEPNPLGYKRNVGEGGSPVLAFNAYVSGNGPVLEEDLPFVDDESEMELSSIQNKDVIKKVTDYSIINNVEKYYMTQSEILQNRNNIKSHIMKYGAVAVAVYAPNDTYFYNSSTYAAYCNMYGLWTNHAVTIVGWDDSFPIENFNSYCRPTKPGAYIVKNSWGELWGDEGYYYVSYEDAFVENLAMGIVKAEDVDYDNLYQHDIYGVAGYIVADPITSLFGINVFEKNTSGIEYLNEVAIATLYPMNYEIYINSTDGTTDAAKFNKVKTSTTPIMGGYYTVKLDTPIALENTHFAVMVKYISIDTNPIYISIESSFPDTDWENASSEVGQSFISDSINGFWEDMSDIDSNLGIKAFTTTKLLTENIEKPTINLNQDSTTNINIEANSNSMGANIIKLKYADGGKNIDYFKSHGEDITISENTSIIEQLTISKLGRYTIYAEDENGNKAVKTIITNKMIGDMILGDFNEDGEIKVMDAYLILKFVSSGADATPEQLAIGDVDGNGKLQVMDAYLILKYVAGLISSF